MLLTCDTHEMHTILQLENLKGRDYLEDLYIYKDNIKMDLKQLEYGYQDCNDLAQNRET